MLLFADDDAAAGEFLFSLVVVALLV